ncbi:uncharacterized protein TRUGW13939_01188 [Talaromyces rugulosus]|uniref:DUF3431 domain-containing protein n=1 Tax=Talaromyces rugulosus TaxID=121627 RepID=A0A7H8QKU8_TALRU|nr:uncharacterized protein TRUGW13939_01188 [Talaromyces rugulosus]QKX54105.1 hypothetical protein TRUGW13939_01188 [Talaromyces rugulosus]
MRPLRNSFPLLAFASFGFVLVAFTTFYLSREDRWRGIPQKLGLGDYVKPPPTKPYYGEDGSAPPFNISEFVPGIPKKGDADATQYSKTLVIAKVKSDDTRWIEENVVGWDTAIYVVDDPTAPLHPPMNKGHEAMVYFSYIIDHYDNLPEIMAFMHAHRTGWHNEEILEFDAAEMLRRLSLERVVRQGYMNMRCMWSPGCPSWLHPGRLHEDQNKKEEFLFASSWSEIFPDMQIPQTLSQPCCGQFALTRERVLSIPRERYVYYRDWLIRTDIRDTMSGRIWEYLWHFVFTAEYEHCPSPNTCLCDGFGICFDTDVKIDAYYQTMWRLRDAKAELKKFVEADGALDEDARISLSLDELQDADLPDGDNKGILLTAEIEEKTAELARLKKEALERGNDPYFRAKSAGRFYNEGDGF